MRQGFICSVPWCIVAPAGYATRLGSSGGQATTIFHQPDKCIHTITDDRSAPLWSRVPSYTVPKFIAVPCWVAAHLWAWVPCLRRAASRLVTRRAPLQVQPTLHLLRRARRLRHLKLLLHQPLRLLFAAILAVPRHPMVSIAQLISTAMHRMYPSLLSQKMGTMKSLLKAYVRPWMLGLNGLTTVLKLVTSPWHANSYLQPSRMSSMPTQTSRIFTRAVDGLSVVSTIF